MREKCSTAKTEKGLSGSMVVEGKNLSLEEELQEELDDGATEDDFVLQQLRRQIAAKKSGKTLEQLYISGSVNRPR